MDDCSSVTGQNWKFVDNGNGLYRMQTELSEAANKCLDANAVYDGAVLGGQGTRGDAVGIA